MGSLASPVLINAVQGLAGSVQSLTGAINGKAQQSQTNNIPAANPPAAPLPAYPAAPYPAAASRRPGRPAFVGISNWYDFDNDEQDDDILDEWIDEDSDLQWIVLNDADDDFIQDNFGYLDFEDDSIWDEIMTNIQTLRGRPLAKKCMNIFGRQLCICEFMDWLNGKQIGGKTKHICYSPKFKGAAITKKTMNKKVNAKKEKLKKKIIALQKKKQKLLLKKEKSVLVNSKQMNAKKKLGQKKIA